MLASGLFPNISPLLPPDLRSGHGGIVWAAYLGPGLLVSPRASGTMADPHGLPKRHSLPFSLLPHRGPAGGVILFLALGHNLSRSMASSTCMSTGTTGARLAGPSAPRGVGQLLIWVSQVPPFGHGLTPGGNGNDIHEIAAESGSKKEDHTLYHTPHDTTPQNIHAMRAAKLGSEGAIPQG
jgi:hypothetical protein